MSLETYVKLICRSRDPDFPDTYCPIDIAQDGTVKQITIGLSLIGFVPDGAQIIGEFDEDSEVLTLYEKPITFVPQVTSNEVKKK